MNWLAPWGLILLSHWLYITLTHVLSVELHPIYPAINENSQTHTEEFSPVLGRERKEAACTSAHRLPRANSSKPHRVVQFWRSTLIGFPYWVCSSEEWRMDLITVAMCSNPDLPPASSCLLPVHLSFLLPTRILLAVSECSLHNRYSARSQEQYSVLAAPLCCHRSGEPVSLFSN